MIIHNVTSSAQPASVTREALPEGGVLVRLADNISAITDEDGAEAWAYDEAVFRLPEGRDDTTAQIQADFAAWWAYASEEDRTPTLEQRVADIEDALLALLG